MSATPSTMLVLGTPIPAFRLPNAVDGRWVSSSDYQDHKPLLVMFICNHCPYVVHIRPVLVKLAHLFLDQGVGVAAVNSNSAKSHPEDGPDSMRRLAVQEGWRFPFLYDESQAVAKTFRAACTPEFYLFDRKKALVYRGQFDGSRPSNGTPVTGEDLKAAVQAVLSGTVPSAEQKPSIGCNIKWSPGNEPDYFR